MKKYIPFLICGSLLFIGAGCSSPASTVPTATPAAINPTSTPSTAANTAINPQLTKLGDLHLFTFDSSAISATYFAVPNIIVGGSPMILASVSSGCVGEQCDGFFRFEQTGSTYAELLKYSLATGVNEGMSQNKTFVTNFSDKDVPALDNIPTQLKDPKTGAVVKYFGDGTGEDALLSGNLFDPTNKRLAFTADGYSVYYATNDNNENYNVESPDGVDLSYQLVDPFIDSAPSFSFIWTNNGRYETELNSFEGCGGTPDNQEVLASTPVSMSDLVVAGKNASGQPIYTLKDPNNPLLVAARAQIKSNGGNVADNATNVISFWQDPFGRIIHLLIGCAG